MTKNESHPIHTQWVVITGGPSSGKTTTVNHLKSLGYNGSPEIARTLIDMGISSGMTTQEIRRDGVRFNQSVLEMQLALENILFPEKMCFLDRGVPDSLAYIRLVGADDTYVKSVISRRRYKAIFLLDLLPFEHDYARTEDEKIAKHIDELIFNTYRELSYNVIRVPVESIQMRSKRILNALGLK